MTILSTRYMFFHTFVFHVLEVMIYKIYEENIFFRITKRYVVYDVNGDKSEKDSASAGRIYARRSLRN